MGEMPWTVGSTLLAAVVFGSCAILFWRKGWDRHLALAYAVLSCSSFLMIFGHMASSEGAKVAFAKASFGVAAVAAVGLLASFLRRRRST